MIPLTDEAIVAACLPLYRATAPDVWGFAWLADTLAVLLTTELAARPRLVVAVDGGLADDLLHAAARLLRAPAWRRATVRHLVSPALIDWWAGWEALAPDLREMGIAMPVDWLLAAWTANLNRPPRAIGGRAIPIAGGAS
jgi:hypothetical protein